MPRPIRRSMSASATVGVAGVLAAAAGSLALGAFVGSVVPQDDAPSASPSATVAASSVTPRPTRPHAAVVTVPRSVDSTGATDVTSQLQQIVDRAPDRALIEFPEGARYRLDRSLVVEGRTGLTFEGNGSQLVQEALGTDPGRAIWRVRESQETTISDFHLIGANPEPGVFRAGFEWQHSVSIEGSDDTVLRHLVMDRPMGDCVYVAQGERAWASGVLVTDSSCEGAARQGVAVVGGREIRVERSTFGVIGLSVLDLEPEAGGTVEQGAEAVVFADNVVDGDYGGRMFNATGHGPIRDVVVERNRVSGARWGISALVAPHEGSPRYFDVVFRANIGEGAIEATGHAVLQFADVDNLIVRDNVQRIESAAAGIHLERVCNVVIRDNDLAPVGRVVEEEGACPSGP